MILDIYPNRDIVLEVADLMNDPDLFLGQFRDLNLKSNSSIMLRLRNWQKFFNKNYINAPCIYSDMNFALIEAAKSNHILKTQTGHEFELSLGFIARLIDSGVFLKINDLQSANYLLNISLVFSKYPGMVVGSFNNSFNLLSNGVNITNLQAMFESLFVKYESPKILIKHLNYLTIDEIAALIHVLKGNNLRTFEKLPITISKKESYIFMNELPDNLSFKNSVLAKAIFASKLLLGSKGDPELLNQFLDAIKSIDTKLETLYEDLNFWRQAYKLVSEIKERDVYFIVQDYVDYFEYMKYTETPDYSLKGRTANSIIQAVDNWHEAAVFAKNRKFANLKWNRRTEKDVIIKNDATEYLFKELTNGVELLKESETLKHCVFSYAQFCVNGLMSIWSLQKKSKNKFQPYITIEVRNKSIVQLGGKHNRWLVKEEINLINEWAEIMKFEKNYVVF